MRNRSGLVLAIGACVLVAGIVSSCNKPAPPPAAPKTPPFMPVVDVKLLMASVVDPAADVIWDSVKITIDKTGEHDKRPKTEEEWTAVRNNAVMLTESGNLLMLAPRAKDDDEWMTFSRAFIEASSKSLEASLERDAAKLMDVGGDIDVACENCHKKYMPTGY